MSIFGDTWKICCIVNVHELTSFMYVYAIVVLAKSMSGHWFYEIIIQAVTDVVMYGFVLGTNDKVVNLAKYKGGPL